MTTANPNPPLLRQALYEISTAQDMPDAKLLDEVVRRYPEYSEELTNFAISVTVDAIRGNTTDESAEAALDPTVISSAVSRAMSRFQNKLYEVKSAQRILDGAVDRSQNLPTQNPFSGLSRTEFRAFAQRLNANAVFAGKLRDRQIDPTTISDGFYSRVSKDLCAPLDVVVAHFAATQQAPLAQFFKAEGKPHTGGQQSFAEAIKNSGLTQEQQDALLGY